MAWQKPVRLAVGAFGCVCAVVIYFAIGSRTASVPPTAVERMDPKSVLESTDAILQQTRKTQEDFEVRAERTINYEDGSVRLFGVRIAVRKRDGRDFVMTAKEAGAGKDRRDLKLTGDVVLEASDGFRLTTDDATYSEEDGFVRAPGKVAFTKGGMSGSGVGMSYDKNNDVLTLLAEPDVMMAGTDASSATSFSSGTAVLDRVMDVLALTGNAKAERGDQMFEAATITARLSDDEQFVRLIELRGDARVAGGTSALDAMSAQAIDMAYVDGGDVLDRVTLTGSASAALKPSGKEPGRRQLLGGVLDLNLAPDGSLIHAAGRDAIRFDLPATPRARASSIQAKTFDAKGQAGAGLTSATFVDSVQFREAARADTPARAARSRTLDVTLRDDEVGQATFTGSVSFEERGLVACAAEVRYDPQAGAIRLSGSDAGGAPRASDAQVAIAAPSIDVTLEGPRINAKGGVRTVLHPPPEARGNCVRQDAGKEDAAAKSTGGDKTEKENRLPGLLRQDAAVNVNADSLTYAGAGGSAVYSGNAVLWQGETTIRADDLRLDQTKGDFVASGSARSTLMLDGKASTGRAREIRYDDERRLVTYDASVPGAPAGGGRGRSGAAPPSPLPGPAAGPRGRAATPAPMQALLRGPQGELQAWRIETVLAADSSRADRLEAYDEVGLRVDTRRATGERLTYFSAEEKYVMSGTAARPVCVVDPNRATTGKTLVFYRTADKVLVDGNEQIRTQTKSGGPCAALPSR